MKTPQQLRFYKTSNLFDLTMAVSVIALEQTLETSPLIQSITIHIDQRIVPEKQFNFEVPDGCLRTTVSG